jgi:hypothetical protein
MPWQPAEQGAASRASARSRFPPRLSSAFGCTRSGITLKEGDRHAALRTMGSCTLALSSRSAAPTNAPPPLPVIGYPSSRSPSESAHIVAAFRRGAGSWLVEARM